MFGQAGPSSGRRVGQCRVCNTVGLMDSKGCCGLQCFSRHKEALKKRATSKRQGNKDSHDNQNTVQATEALCEQSAFWGRLCCQQAFATKRLFLACLVKATCPEAVLGSRSHLLEGWTCHAATPGHSAAAFATLAKLHGAARVVQGWYRQKKA